MFIQHWCFYRLFCTLQAKKVGKTERDTYQPPFYYNFDFTCLVSAHAQTLNEYPDTKKQIRMFSSWMIFWIISPALIIMYNTAIFSDLALLFDFVVRKCVLLPGYDLMFRFVSIHNTDLCQVILIECCHKSGCQCFI